MDVGGCGEGKRRRETESELLEDLRGQKRTWTGPAEERSARTKTKTKRQSTE